MRRTVAALVALPLITLAGCASETPSRDVGGADAGRPATPKATAVANPDLPLIGTRWVLESFGDTAGGDDTVTSAPERRPSTLRLEKDQVNFDDSCNSGGARVVIEGSTLLIDTILSTTAGCGPSGGVLGAVSAVLRDQAKVKYFIEGDQVVLTRGNASLTNRGH